MHHHLELIPTLTGGLAAALLLGYITHRLGLSPIVGYLLAGLAVGPNTPGFVANRELAEQLAEIGVILLMFGVGLHFHLNDLLAVRRIAVPGAIAQCLFATLLGAISGWCFHYSWGGSLIFGLAISVASTVVLTRVLADNNDMHTPVGHIAIGWLIVEDLFTVLVLVLLPTIFGEHSSGITQVLGAILLACVKVAVLVGLTVVVGDRFIPYLLSRVAATRSRELFTLTVLVVALGIAVGSSRLFGVSMALGAFLAGMVVGRSEFSLRAATDALPMRDAFAVLFFVSVGMLFDPVQLLDAPWVVAITVAIVLIGKPLAAVAIVLMLGYPVRTALAVAIALAQIGEFSFILVSVGNDLQIFNAQASNALVATAIISISLSPLLYRLVGPLEAWAIRRPRLWRWLNSRVVQPAGPSVDPAAGPVSTDLRHRAVVAGFGPVGRTVCRLLQENGISPCVMEMNLQTVRTLRQDGIPAVYGDAVHAETLRSAGVDQAGTLILSVAGITGTEEVIRQAREMNPAIRILVRSNYLREVPGLMQAGASQVFSGEGEVALSMAVAMLGDLGATPDQIDRERARVQADLFCKPTVTVEPTSPKNTDAETSATAPAS
ncbi:MAG: cation:proton antiporter [Planctomycetes bacterium]|nr:cation:proton antiporter [Planctomycetota bacterium]